MGQLFTISFSNVAATGFDKDLFFIQPSTTTRLKISNLSVWKTTIGSSEGVALKVVAGSSIPSSGGSTLGVTWVDSRSSSTAPFIGLMNSTGPGSSGASARLLFSGALNDNTNPFVWAPPNYGKGTQVVDERAVIGTPLAAGESLQVRMNASAASMLVSGNLTVEVIGKT